jgi:hypothetical protein
MIRAMVTGLYVSGNALTGLGEEDETVRVDSASMDGTGDGISCGK